jgi:hypothetical protein
MVAIIAGSPAAHLNGEQKHALAVEAVNILLCVLLPGLPQDEIDLKRAIKIVGVKGLIAGLMASVVCVWAMIWRWIGVPWWCNRITRAVW